MSRTSLRDAEDRTPDVSSQPKVSRRSVSRALSHGAVCPHRSEVNTIRALMDLALPKFDGFLSLMASPDPVCSTDLLRSPSPCLNLDALSSDDAEESVRLGDISVTLLCGSVDGHTPRYFRSGPVG